MPSRLILRLLVVFTRQLEILVTTLRVCAVTAFHALQSSAGLQGFRSEIGYQFFDQV